MYIYISELVAVSCQDLPLLVFSSVIEHFHVALAADAAPMALAVVPIAEKSANERLQEQVQILNAEISKLRARVVGAQRKTRNWKLKLTHERKRRKSAVNALNRLYFMADGARRKDALFEGGGKKILPFLVQ